MIGHPPDTPRAERGGAIPERWALPLLRLGLGITFLWTGWMIVTEPTAWANFLPPSFRPWLPLSPEAMTRAIGGFDILLGFWLFADRLLWLAGLVASLHLLGILIVVGVDAITVRDIGLLGAALALVCARWPGRRPRYQ